RMFLERAADLHRALRRLFGTPVKHQGHAVAGRDFQQTPDALRLSKFIRCSNELVQFLDARVLVVNRELGIANDVNEENVSDLYLNLFFYITGHYNFGASDATIFSNLGSPRKGSQ